MKNTSRCKIWYTMIYLEKEKRCQFLIKTWPEMFILHVQWNIFWNMFTSSSSQKWKPQNRLIKHPSIGLTTNACFNVFSMFFFSKNNKLFGFKKKTTKRFGWQKTNILLVGTWPRTRRRPRRCGSSRSRSPRCTYVDEPTWTTGGNEPLKLTGWCWKMLEAWNLKCMKNGLTSVFWNMLKFFRSFFVAICSVTLKKSEVDTCESWWTPRHGFFGVSFDHFSTFSHFSLDLAIVDDCGKPSPAMQMYGWEENCRLSPCVFRVHQTLKNKNIKPRVGWSSYFWHLLAVFAENQGDKTNKFLSTMSFRHRGLRRCLYVHNMVTPFNEGIK